MFVCVSGARVLISLSEGCGDEFSLGRLLAVFVGTEYWLGFFLFSTGVVMGLTVDCWWEEGNNLLRLSSLFHEGFSEYIGTTHLKMVSLLRGTDELWFSWRGFKVIISVFELAENVIREGLAEVLL